MYPFGKQRREWAKSLLSSRSKVTRSLEPDKNPASTIPRIILTAMYRIEPDRTLCLRARSSPLSITARLRNLPIQAAGFQMRCDEQYSGKPADVMAALRGGGFIAAYAVLLLFLVPLTLQAQTDCLSCHSDVTMQDASGQNIGVDAPTFHSSVHGSLECSACHTSITAYPHPDHPLAVKCLSCHADEAVAVVGSVHENASTHPCTSCHGSAHAILPKDNPKSAVYPLNIPATCGKCHGDAAIAKRNHLANVYPTYMDSIHGYAVSQEGLLVAANCESCHGAHHILSHNNAQSPTYKTNIPDTCGKCHAGILTQYMEGVHGQALAGGNLKAPACTDCHTAHAIAQPSMALSTPMCGSCHQAQLSTYRDTFHSQVSDLGSYVEVARCSDCHGEHEILPASDPLSPVNPANLVHTCGRCHQNANAGFVKYEPHAKPDNRRLSPVLYYIRLFMVLLISGVMTFFLLHTLLWLIRSLVEKPNGGSARGEK